MTATNLIVQPDAAHLITDAAFYDAAGTLVEIRSKLVTSAEMHMALSSGGCLYPHRLVEDMESGPLSQKELLERLPAKAMQLRRGNAIGNPDGEPTGHNDFHVYLILWSHDHGRPEGWALSSTAGWFGKKYEPFDWAPVDQIQTPPPPIAADPARFKPLRDGRALLDQQRKHPQLGAFVGGFGEVASVRRSGVTIDRVVTWPDKVGQPITA